MKSHKISEERFSYENKSEYCEFIVIEGIQNHFKSTTTAFKVQSIRLNLVLALLVLLFLSVVPLIAAVFHVYIL